ncbi:MAG TPA: fatty acid desaturase [Rhizomicrobium sp.]|nr:fatty acid desaturase [Rhizomicrobium sp.]
MSSASRFAPAGAFAREINAKGHALLAGQSRFADPSQFAIAALFAGLGLAAYGLLLAGAPHAPLLVMAAAFCAFMLIVQLGHDAAHGALSPRPWVNRAALFASFGVLGVDGMLWRDRHIRLHHQVVNLPGTGIDADSISVFRLAPDKPWRWWMRLQPVYGPLLYAIGHLHLAWIEDFAAFRAARRRRGFSGAGPLAGFAGGKLVHVILFLLLPWLARRPSPEDLALGYLLASAVIALCFVVLVVGTHVSDLAAFPQADARGRLPHDWATHQLITSVDWSPQSRLAVLLTGGANAHAAHHLFPGHHHRHMAALSGLIGETAAAHGLPHHVTSFAGMVRGQWRHLVALSRPEAGSIICDSGRRHPA